MAPEAEYPLHTLTIQILTAIIAQIFAFNNGKVSFWSCNSHVPHAERSHIELAVLGPLRDAAISWVGWRPDWPVQYPLFSPYASQKPEVGYSQVRYKLPGTPVGELGTKFSCHRAAYVQQHGVFSLQGDGIEVSHCKFLGIRTGRNINPRHTYAEPGRFNKSRWHCHLYMSLKLRDSLFAFGKPATEPQLSNAQITAITAPLFNPITMPTCAFLHPAVPCTVDVRAWLHDHYIEEVTDGEDSPYDSEYETDADAAERLGEYGGLAFSPGHQFPPPSSMPNYPSSSSPARR